ncbi:MAG TPA: hypothetical protein VHP36_06120 [Chitinispirillaceae bacterium]|nr:hypothetical protein [Chitinispirillaceae bacterium]
MTFFKKASGVFLTGALLLTVGCASVSNFQTGKPLGKGNVQAYFSVSHIDTKNDTVPLIETVPEFTFFELGATMGLTDRLDLGLKYTFPTAGFIDSKYCLVGSGKQKGVFLSPGLRAGYTAFPKQEGEEENDRVEFSVPIYLTFGFSEVFSLSLIPTYSGRFFTSGSYYTNLLGGNVNFKIGKRFGVIADVAVYQNFKWEWQEIQAGGAMFFPLPEITFFK